MPIVYYSTPIIDDFNRASGVLVIEIAVQPLFDELKSTNPEETTIIIDVDGTYLSHPQANKLFGVLLKTGESFIKDQPNDAHVMAGQDFGSEVGSQDRPDVLQDFAHISLPDQPQISWTLIRQIPLNKILMEVSAARSIVLFITAILLAAAVAIGVILVRTIAHPIGSLAPPHVLLLLAT